MTSDEAIDWADRLRDWLPATSGDVLALGPGTGGLALLAADQGHRVTEVPVGDTECPLGRGRRFDVVLAHDALGTTADPEAALRRWRGLLRPGGRLVLVASARGTGSPVALPMSRLVAALTPLVARLHSERLSGDARLSGAPAEDERYALVGVVPDAPARHTEVVDVHLIVRRGDEVLLARRAGTGYGDGLLHLPSGHVEDGEDVRAAVIREAREELGLDLAPADLRMEAVVQHRGPGEAPRVGWFFSAEHGAGGEPVNAEPDKCAELVWHPLSALPHDMVAYCRAGLAAWRAGERFIVHWQSDEEAVAYEGERTTAPESLAPVRTGGVHHVELWVPDLAAAEISWGWLLGELGHVPFQRWGHGRSWRRDEAYVVLEQSPDLRPGGHDRHRPGLNHLAFHVAGRAVLDRLVAAAPDHGWALLFADRHPHAGGEGRYAAYLEDAWGYEVELVAE